MQRGEVRATATAHRLSWNVEKTVCIAYTRLSEVRESYMYANDHPGLSVDIAEKELLTISGLTRS